MAIQDDPIIKEYVFKVDERIKEISAYMAKGSCSTIEEYKKHAGIVKGFNLALDILDDVIKNYGKEEED